MTNRNNDDVARALEALSAGQHAQETEHPAPDGSAPRAPAAVPAPRPAAPRPPAAARAATPGPSPVARPATPAASRPATPAAGRPAAPGAARSPQPGAAPAAGRPAAPQPAAPATTQRPSSPAAARPAAPTARPTAPTARPVTPATPVVVAHPEQSQVVDDDDAVIVPAPDASVFLHKPDYAAKAKARAVNQRIGLRRTFIPILLTGGFIMMGLALLHFVWHADNNPMGGLPVWLVAVLFLFALVLWVLAFANMMTVKHLMEGQQKAAA